MVWKGCKLSPSIYRCGKIGDLLIKCIPHNKNNRSSGYTAKSDGQRHTEWGAVAIIGRKGSPREARED